MALEPQAANLADTLSRLPPLGSNEISDPRAGAVAGQPPTGFVAATRRALESQAAFNVAVAQTVDTGPPVGPAGGDLAGEYPNPVLADGVVDIPNIDPTILNAPSGLVQLDDNAQVPVAQLPFLSPGQWEDDAQPPPGTSATPYLPILPSGPNVRARLKSLTYWNAFAPATGETLTLRVYKYLADGSGFVLMTDPLVVDSSFADFTTVDVSGQIRANRFWVAGDVLALSRVYVAGPARLQAPLISWLFELVPEDAVADVVVPTPGAWPP